MKIICGMKTLQSVLVTVFCFHLLESRRRGVSRSDDPQSVFPRDFNFADQINSTCHYFVETSFYTTEDYHPTIQILRSTIDDIQAELVCIYTGCPKLLKQLYQKCPFIIREAFLYPRLPVFQFV